VPTGLAERIEAVLGLDPGSDAIEFDGTWITWGQLAAMAHACRDQVLRHTSQRGDAVGVVLRNHPSVVGALLGVLLADRCVVTVNPNQGDAALEADLVALRVPVVVACGTDWKRPGMLHAARTVGSAGVRVELVGDEPAVTVLSGAGDAGSHREPRPGVAVEMLTSGTTGPPKRVPLEFDSFERTIGAARSHYSRSGDRPPGVRLRSGVALVNAPLVHMSGLFRTLLNICEGRPVALLERFELEGWLEAVRRHRPRAVSLVPAALGMVLDADVDPEDLESLQVVTSGTAALSPALQAAFEDRYGVAVLPSYGATEFAGGVAGWTLALHEEWATRKRGSVGRAQPGRSVRIVDDAGEPESPDVSGTIEVRTGDGEWVRTTDLGRLDPDGFLWIEGRADDAILRGGFKVFPGEIVDVLRAHDDVVDAGATGVPDDRLGAVPVAAVELRPGSELTEAEILAHLQDHLAGYKVPARVRVVAALPRTPSMKVSQPALAELFETHVGGQS
jgi:long-chain acyl-CoA synthetase